MYLPNNPTSCMARRIGATLPRLIENLQNVSEHAGRRGIPVDQGQALTNHLGQIRMQTQAALLAWQKNPHEPARLVFKHPRENRMNLAGGKPETVDDLGRRLFEWRRDEPAELRMSRQQLGLRQKRQAFLSVRVRR